MMRFGVSLLLVLGLAQMAADVTDHPALKALFAATAASPAPKVFSAVRGYETYTTRFTILWTDAEGTARSLVLTPEVNARFKGPYNRRNVYGAVLSYGPALAAHERSKPMLDQVLRFALCGDAPILKEIGVDTVGIRDVRIRYDAKQNPEGLPMLLEAPCTAE